MTPQHPTPGLPEAAKHKVAGFNWKDSLVTRRYQFAGSGAAEGDLATRIDHDGLGWFFPLGTTDAAEAAEKAKQIYEAVLKEGWTAVCSKFSRELIVSFEWKSNPVLWTYTTLHTLASARKPRASAGHKVLVVEMDPGVSRALCWSVDQHPGFAGVPCLSMESFNQALKLHKPSIILLNRELSGRAGHEATGAITTVSPGILG